MSLLNKASLIQIPSGYKDGTLYSAKPTNGDGDFTFSRGSNLAATRVNSDGLIEKGRENLLLYSQDFSQSNWSVIDSTKVGTTEIDPNGGSTACNVTWVSGGSSKYLFQNILTGNLLCISMYVKSNGGGNKFRLFGDGATDFSQDFTATNEWQRFEFFFERGTGQGTGIASASDNSASDLLVAFAQVESGLVATDYIETGATTAQAGILEDMPRLDYSGGASCPSLLLEPQRTNLFNYSEYFEGSYWGKTQQGSASVPVVTGNYAISPEGVQNATRVQFDAVGSTSSDRSGLVRDFAFTSGTTYSISCWVKATSGNNELVQFRVAGAQVGGEQTATDEWQLFTATHTATASVTDNFGMQVRGNNTTNESDILIYGMQLEQSASYASSYIPTYGASVTRSQDYCVKTGISSLIGQTEGTFFAEFEYNGFNGTISQNALYTRAAGSTSNYLYINIYNGRINIGLRVNSTTLFDTLQGPNPLSEGVHKCAFAYKSGDIVIYLDGQNIYVPSNNVYSNLSLAELGIGNNTTGGNQLGDGLNQVLVFKTRLTNDELATLTTI